MAQKWIVLLLSAGFLGVTLPATAGDGFLNEIEDLPLAEGLVEASGGLLFDTADGRIVEAIASGNANARQIGRFYTETLPQLGWQPLGGLRFYRDKEVLQVVIDDRRHPVVVRFSLAPRANDN